MIFNSSLKLRDLKFPNQTMIVTDDCLREILSWLPPKSLRRLQRVSKKFLNIISDPFFKTLHTNHFQTRYNINNINFSKCHHSELQPVKTLAFFRDDDYGDNRGPYCTIRFFNNNIICREVPLPRVCHNHPPEPTSSSPPPPSPPPSPPPPPPPSSSRGRSRYNKRTRAGSDEVTGSVGRLPTRKRGRPAQRRRQKRT